MSEARMASEEDFNRVLMNVRGGEGNYQPDPHQTGGDGGPHLRNNSALLYPSGDVVFLKPHYPLQFTVDTTVLEQAISKRLLSYVGEQLTPELIRRLIAEVADEVREMYLHPKTTFENEADKPTVVKEGAPCQS
jgi:hypothetical protein